MRVAEYYQIPKIENSTETSCELTGILDDLCYVFNTPIDKEMDGCTRTCLELVIKHHFWENLITSVSGGKRDTMMSPGAFCI